MAVLTEQDLIRFLKSGSKVITLEAGTVITPSAKDRIKAKGIQVVFSGNDTGADMVSIRKPWEQIKEWSSGKTQEQRTFVNLETGEKLFEKPEHLTAIRGNNLVLKNNPRIIFRGKLDTFISYLLILMLDADEAGNQDMLRDLETIEAFVYDLQTAEVGEKPLRYIDFLGLNSDQIREQSHYSGKYYGTDHLFQMDYRQSRDLLKTNRLRALSRELELAAFEAFFDGKKITRGDIIEALNRLSSALYIIELKKKGGIY